MDDLSSSQITLPGGYVGELCARYDTPVFRQWLEALPALLAGSEARLVYRLRNRIYRVADPENPNGPGICVKAFKAPPLLRAIHYRSVGSKAARSHRFALHLHAHGAGATEPIGYFERWQGLRLVECYLLTRFLEDSTDLYSEMSRLLREDPDCEKYLALLRFTAVATRRMHDCGFAHNDLGGQNLLLRRTGDAAWADPVFIDLNRGDLLPSVSLRARARDLAKLEIPSHFRRIFFQMYFDDGAIPREFARWENWQRLRITFHNESRKYRHPIRHWIQSRRHIVISTGRPSYRDTWLWDDKSGQPSVVLESRDRRRYRHSSDLFRVATANLRSAPALWKSYRELRRQAYVQPVELRDRFGLCVEVTSDFPSTLKVLAEVPGIPVLVRCYFSKGSAGIDACASAIAQLVAAGHEVSLGVIQSRRAILAPAEWQAFLAEVFRRLHAQVRFVEIGHAVNRVKWGMWGICEVVSLWGNVAEMRRLYPQLTILGPAVNDFEYHCYAPLLSRMKGLLDGVSNHLYVDRRGAPENFQGRFSLLEKCVLGRAMAESHGLHGFYVTETNWPLTGAGEHSPLAGAYTPKHYVESALHVDESTYAAYMVRYALIALCSGMTERVWWWRMAARGYGLMDDVGGLTPRVAWRALVQYHKTIGRDRFLRREEREGALWWHFEKHIVAYALAPTSVIVPAGCTCFDMEGRPIATAGSLALSGSPVYFTR
jgi:hypothetical protein